MSLSKPVSSFYIYTFDPKQAIDIEEFCDSISEQEIKSIEGKDLVERINFVSPDNVFKKGMATHREFAIFSVRLDKKSLSPYKVEREMKKIIKEDYGEFPSLDEFKKSVDSQFWRHVQSTARGEVAKVTTPREQKINVIVNFKRGRLYIDKSSVAKSIVNEISYVTGLSFKQYCFYPDNMFEEEELITTNTLNSLFFLWVYAYANKVKNVPEVDVSLGNTIVFDDRANKLTANGNLYLFFDNFKKMRDVKKISKIELAIKEVVKREDGTAEEKNRVIYTLTNKDCGLDKVYSDVIKNPKYADYREFVDSQMDAYEELEDHLEKLGEQFCKVLGKYKPHDILKWVS